MQITIVQSEIEEAIKNYICGQINIKDGMEIDIDLRATRGAEGYQAIIDIGYPDVNEARIAQQPIRVTPAEPVEETVEEEAAPKRRGRPPLNREEKVEEEPPFTPDVQEKEETIEADLPVKEDKPAEEAPRQSLFGGLTKG